MSAIHASIRKTTAYGYVVRTDTDGDIFQAVSISAAISFCTARKFAWTIV